MGRGRTRNADYCLNSKRKAKMTSTARALCGDPSNVITVKDKPDEPATLKHIGGSPSDEWNNVLIGQVADCLWLKNSSSELRNRQAGAAIAALISFKPADELESMLAAQLIACHNAGMECFRRAMHGEQTFAGRSENLSQANKLSRSFAVLTGGPQPSPRQRAAESHRRACACQQWWASHRRHCH